MEFVEIMTKGKGAIGQEQLHAYIEAQNEGLGGAVWNTLQRWNLITVQKYKISELTEDEASLITAKSYDRAGLARALLSARPLRPPHKIQRPYDRTKLADDLLRLTIPNAPHVIRQKPAGYAGEIRLPVTFNITGEYDGKTMKLLNITTGYAKEFKIPTPEAWKEAVPKPQKKKKKK